MGKKSVNVIAVLSLGLILTAFWFYPVQHQTCRGRGVCYGVVPNLKRDRLTLNARHSQLEIRKENTFGCLGFSRRTLWIEDACNGDMVWFNWRDVDCNMVFQRCLRGEKLPYGITCEEWSRACEALSHHDTVSIKITDYNKTGVIVRCDSAIASSTPGGPLELEKFIKTHFAFPDSVKRKEIDAKIAFGFSIDTTGQIGVVFFREPKLLQYYENELQRVLARMPRWSISYCDSRKIERNFSYVLSISSDATEPSPGITLTTVE